jgi:ComF family protein
MWHSMILGGLFDQRVDGDANRRTLGWRRYALPQRCFFCAAESDAAVCEPCELSLPATDRAACPRCQLPSVAAQVCGRCLKRPPQWNSLFAPWRYEFPINRAVVSGKRAANFPLYDWFAKSAAVAGIAIERSALAVAVPSSAERLQVRGYNHAALIAKQVASAQACRFDDTAFVRIRATEGQHHRDWVERRAHVRGAFAATRPLLGEHLLLIDDVLTTGATLNELARVALEAGAKRVDALVIARAQPTRRRERIAKFGQLVR